MVQLREIEGRLQVMREWERSGEGEKVRHDFCEMVSAAMEPLTMMRWILRRLVKQRPAELRTNHHAIEEWREDVALVANMVASCFVEAARVAETKDLGEAAKVLAGIRNIRLLKWAFELVTPSGDCWFIVTVLIITYVPQRQDLHPTAKAGQPYGHDCAKARRENCREGVELCGRASPGACDRRATCIRQGKRFQFGEHIWRH